MSSPRHFDSKPFHLKGFRTQQKKPKNANNQYFIMTYAFKVGRYKDCDCRTCGEPFSEGQLVYRLRTKRLYHLECWSKAQIDVRRDAKKHE